MNEMNGKYIAVWRTLMAPKNVADAFGRRIAKRYIAIQLTVANRNTEYQWLIQSASVNLDKLVLNLSAKSACQPNVTQLLQALQSLGAKPTGSTIGGPSTVSSASRKPFRSTLSISGGS